MRNTYPALDGLLDLGQRDGVDIRPTLLRVLTDIYVQIPVHTPEDERHYTELALRLIGSTDVAVRAAVAERLARYPAAPRLVIQRLAHDLLVVAEPILRHTHCLTAEDLAAIAHECGSSHAAVIAARTASSDADATGKQSDQVNPSNTQAVQLCELFFAANATERRLILTNLEYASTPSSPPAPASKEAIRRLEAAALAHNGEAFIRELEAALSISIAQARRVANDELGEPLVVAAKALGAAPEVLQRILLFVNPVIGHSVQRVYDLADLYDEISGDAARHLLMIWRESDPPLPRRNRTLTTRRGDREESRRTVTAERDTLRFDVLGRPAKSERG